MNLRDALLAGKETLAIWGLGFIGTTSLMEFAAQGVSVIGYDVDEEKVKDLNHGHFPMPNVEAWAGRRWADTLAFPHVRVSSTLQPFYVNPPAVHLVCVPTERDGHPWDGAIHVVSEAIEILSNMGGALPLVIVESTLDLLMWSSLVKNLRRVAVSPRRDWFANREKSLSTLPRVLGAADGFTRDRAAEVIGLVSPDLRLAESAESAILSKLIENEILHLGANLAGELARRFPAVNVRESFELASSHWRTPLYYPSAGVGGYCVPMASRYLCQGSRGIERGLLRANEEIDVSHPRNVALELRRLVQGRGPLGGGILVLGVTYKGDIPVTTLSPALTIIEDLVAKNLPLTVHDPYWTDLCLPEIVASLSIKEGTTILQQVARSAVIFIHTDHRAYAEWSQATLLAHIQSGAAVLDGTGIWKRHARAFAQAGIQYRVIGEPGWIESSTT